MRQCGLAIAVCALLLACCLISCTVDRARSQQMAAVAPGPGPAPEAVNAVEGSPDMASAPGGAAGAGTLNRDTEDKMQRHFEDTKKRLIHLEAMLDKQTKEGKRR